MTAGAATLAFPSLIVDPLDYFVVDIAVGRHLPGGTVHASQLAYEHGLTDEEALDALDAAVCLGLASRRTGEGDVSVSWSPSVSQSHLHRLARAMVMAVGAINDRDPYGIDLIDGERDRFGAVEFFGLTTPCDVELFLELARALLARRSIAVVDDLVSPIAILFSETAQHVHGLEFAADERYRQELVSGLVRSLLDGRSEAFVDLLADYVVALSVD